MGDVNSIATSGLLAINEDLATTANNIANSETVGYKTKSTEFSELYAGSGSGVIVEGTSTDFSTGSIERTGINTHVAINGEGFFAVQKPGSDAALFTRAGNFSVGETGDLATAAGYPVLGYAVTDGVADQVPTPISVPDIMPPEATSEIVIQANLSAAPEPGDQFDLNASMYDSLGFTHQLQISVTPATATQVDTYNGDNAATNAEKKLADAQAYLTETEGVREEIRQITERAEEIEGQANDMIDSLELLVTLESGSPDPAVREAAYEESIIELQAMEDKLLAIMEQLNDDDFKILGDDPQALAGVLGSEDEFTVSEVPDLLGDVKSTITDMINKIDDVQVIVRGPDENNPTIPASLTEPELTNLQGDIDAMNSDIQRLVDDMEAANTQADAQVKLAADKVDKAEDNLDRSLRGRWVAQYRFDGSDEDLLLGGQMLVFGDSGTVIGGKSVVTLDLDFGNGAQDSQVSIDLSEITQLGHQYRSETPDTNGWESGILEGVNIADDGMVYGTFTNGETLDISQLAIATFESNEALSQQGNSLWSPETGNEVTYTTSGKAAGNLLTGSVEGSNVNTTEEMIRLTELEMVYQLNSQVLSVQKELDKVLINI